MKRISLPVIVILLTVPSLTEARIYDYGSLRYRTRWSPYAFSHKRSGLISGYYGYSPYAFSHKNSGLIPRDVRYSPYAFSHKSSGLIYENIGYSPYAFNYKHSGLIDYDYNVGQYSPGRAPVFVVYAEGSTCSDNDKPLASDETNKNRYTKQISRRERIQMQMDDRKQVKSAKEKDAKDIICRFLKDRNIDDFKMTGIFRIEGKVINVNFLLKDKNLMITYWDLDEVESLIKQPGNHRNYLEKHERQWKTACNQYTQAGGKIFPITSTDENEILAKLTLCNELNGG